MHYPIGTYSKILKNHSTYSLPAFGLQALRITDDFLVKLSSSHYNYAACILFLLAQLLSNRKLGQT